MSGCTASTTARYVSTTWSATACSTDDGPSASRSGAASSRCRTSASAEWSPWRTLTTKSRPQKSMISPVSTISLVVVTDSCST